MINGIPKPTDFESHGIDYLNLGWSAILEVLHDYADAEEMTGGVEPEMKTDFWIAAERELATALSLIEQGAEFLLKAKICNISPWLLISRNPSDWPRKCEKEDIQYSQFRTIDAQDLLKVHNTFAPARLPDEFATVFDSLRRERNSIMHTVDINLRIIVSSLLEYILIVAEHLIGPRSWVTSRREYIQRDRFSAIGDASEDYRVAREFLTAVELLSPSQLKRFFAFDKRQRVYGCPNCCHSSKYAELECRTGVLRPNEPQSTSLHCFICDVESTVERRDCTNVGCNGNVFDPEWDECLTCLRRPA